MHISRGENEKNNTFIELLTVARALWQGFETEIRSPNFCSWPARQSCACKTHFKWSIHCWSGGKRQGYIFLWLWAPFIPIDFYRSSTPYSAWDPDPHQPPPCRGNLDAYSGWEPWCSLKKCWPGRPEELGHRTYHKAHKDKHSCSSCSLSHWQCWGCAMWTTSSKSKSKSASCTIHFTDSSLLFFLTLLYWCFSTVHCCSPLPLFPWHSTFYPF